ncbi:HNH endonuclease [Roseovarius sp. S4756]|uniref:HNH endonuclease n=1 Tax=Roseovarius maritimus TaxID=3342637 RepID=UPI00372726E1
MDMHVTRSIKKIRQSKFKAQNGRCHYCRQPMWVASSDKFRLRFGMSAKQSAKFQCTAEHVQARCDGGPDASSNIVAACKFCNQTRHSAKDALSEKQYKEKVIRRLKGGKWHGFLVMPP